ncbi:calcium/sodium antiporter [Fervidobacterium thailandense]|uniref:Sodium:proton exchanger n=1 Tax=Fervidobacterium thailandense TaxID=1008305 RepID=A0A1E3G380_9BACT|nr:calcium/sodium antiporter [Fervidobacterium thailandense]ODN30721.1 sodium:proton exchanger [Fervidobacterium thailandense]
MALSLLLLIFGFVLVSYGADKLVEGASSLAKRLRVSDLLIGLTIVSFGTSAPELAVNIVSSLKGSSEISLGNVVGSNIFNLLGVVGTSALIKPVIVKHSTLRKEIPLSLIAALSLLALGSKSTSIITRGDGVVLLLFFVIFLSYVLEMAKKDREMFDELAVTKESNIPVWLSIIYIIGGLVGLSLGGRWIVNGAVEIARAFKVSEKFIGLTIVAIGTSIPELATSLVASIKGNDEIALGNAVGSNIFNIFFILGISALISPIQYNSALNADLWFLVAVTSVLIIFSKDLRIQRLEGLGMIIGYIGYTVFLFIRK